LGLRETKSKPDFAKWVAMPGLVRLNDEVCGKTNGASRLILGEQA
jgi:hypothetical protein